VKMLKNDVGPLRNIRLQAGLTQQEAATLARVSVRTWQEYESGRVDMHPHVLKAWLDAVRPLSPVPRGRNGPRDRHLDLKEE